MIWLYFGRCRAPASPGHECPGYASTEKPGEPGSWRSGSDFGAGFSRLFVSHVARAFMPGRGGPGNPSVVPALHLLLPRLDAHRQLVLGRRQRAGGEGGEGAGRVVGGVEVDYHLAVLGRIGVEEAAGAV